jgi:hypothetical protein
MHTVISHDYDSFLVLQPYTHLTMSSDISLSELTTSDLYALLKPITIPPNASRARFINWGKTYQCRPLAVFEPVNELQCRYLIELAKREGKSLRPVGAGHSPSDLACTNAFMMRTGKLDRFIAVRELAYPYLLLWRRLPLKFVFHSF